MKRKALAMWAALALLLTLAGCGGGANGAKGSGDMNFTATDSVSQNAPAASEEAGWDAPMEAPAPEPDGSYGGGNVPANAKIIYTAEMDLETKEFDQASQALADTVADLGGYFESRSLNQGGQYRSLSCTVRIPVENFVAFLDRAGEAAHVTSRHEDQEDVSENYYDQEARLTTQRTKLERLQELLAKAESMEDIITLESAISETELQIEYLTGSLRKYDSLISYSTVNLYLREVYRLSGDEEIPVTFGDRLGSAFSTGLQRGVEGLEDFTISLARNWMGLLIWAAVIAAIILLVRRLNRKRRAARAVPPPAPSPVRPEPDAAGTEEPAPDKKE